MTHADEILRAAGALIETGRREMSRKDIRDLLGLTSEQWALGYTAIFQAMRSDHPGGAPPVAKQYQGIFRQIARGRFAVTESGQRRAREANVGATRVRAPGVRGSRGSVPVEGKGGLRQVIIYPGEDEHWVAECPSLPGCVSQGRSRREAIANVRDAIQAYVAALMDDDLPVPEERFEAVLIAV